MCGATCDDVVWKAQGNVAIVKVSTESRCIIMANSPAGLNGSLTATLSGYVATKQINGCKIDSLTVEPNKPEYENTTSVVGPALGFYAKPDDGHADCPMDITWEIDSGAGTLYPNGKSAIFTPNLKMETRVIKAKDARSGETGDAGVSVIPLDFTISDVHTPSEDAEPMGADSFISVDTIYGTAVITPLAAHATFKSNIQWNVTYTDEDGTLLPSEKAGEFATWMPNPPIVPPGRFPYVLKYEINAKVTVNGYTIKTSPKNIQQDRRDALRQEYTGHDVNVPPIPPRADIIDISSYTSTNFPFAEVNSGFYPDLMIFKIVQHLEHIRTAIGNQTMKVTSGFRDPSKNAATRDADRYSAHQFGRAADIALRDWNGDEVADSRDQDYIYNFVIAEGGTTEPFYKTPTWVHMQWK